MAAPIQSQPPSFPSRELRFGPFFQGQNQTTITAHVTWDGEEYEITWRGGGLYTEEYAHTAIEGKLDQLFILHTRYMEAGVTKLSWDGENQVTRELQNGKNKNPINLGKDWIFYTPERQANLVKFKSSIEALQAELKVEEEKPAQAQNANLIKTLRERIASDSSRFNKKLRHLVQKKKAQDLYEIFRSRQHPVPALPAAPAAPQLLQQAPVQPVVPVAAPAVLPVVPVIAPAEEVEPIEPVQRGPKPATRPKTNDELFEEMFLKDDRLLGEIIGEGA